MPAKRKMLPRPCPKCGRPNGTIRVFNDIRARHGGVICFGIGHYDPVEYLTKNPGFKHSTSFAGFTTEEIPAKKTRGKLWCYFNSDFLSERLEQYFWVKYRGRWIPLKHFRRLNEGRSAAVSKRLIYFISTMGWRDNGIKACPWPIGRPKSIPRKIRALSAKNGGAP